MVICGANKAMIERSWMSLNDVVALTVCDSTDRKDSKK